MEKESANSFPLFSSLTMDPSPGHDAPQEPAAPRDPRRESSDEKIVDDELENARVAALKAQERFKALQRRRQKKATPRIPALTPAVAESGETGTPRQERRAPQPLPEKPKGPAPPPPTLSLIHI